MIFRDLHAFNLILLFKQSWKVLTEQDSLVLTILNARYFLNTSLLQINNIPRQNVSFL